MLFNIIGKQDDLNINKRILYLAVFLTSQFLLTGQQNNLQEYQDIKKTVGISLGYLHSSWENTDKTYHGIKAEYYRVLFDSRHYVAFTTWSGLETYFNTSDFILGPKMGLSFNYGPFLLGLESFLYTNFYRSTFRIGPILGLGTHVFKIEAIPQIKLINTDFHPVNQGQISLTFNLITLASK